MTTSDGPRLGEDDRRTLELLAVVLASAVSRAAEFDAKQRQVDALARFEATYAGALAGIMTLDLEGAIVDANPALQELMGYTADEFAGPRAEDYVHPEDRDDVLAQYRRMARGEQGAGPFEHRIICKDGELRWVTSSVSFIRDADGQPDPGRPDGPGRDAAQGRRGRAARPVRAERAPGPPRRADRPAQPNPVQRAHRACAGRRPPGRGPRGRDADGPRPLQGGQRLARPSRRRPAAAGGRAPALRGAALLGLDRAARRRRVRRPAARGRTTPPAWSRWSRSSWRRSRSRSPCSTCRWWWRPRSGSRCHRTTASTWTRSCAPPTSPCTRPRRSRPTTPSSTAPPSSSTWPA